MPGASDLDVWFAFAAPPNSVLSTDISAQVESMRFTYGRESANRLTGKIVAGSCEIIVRNDDDDWSPYNTSGAYYNNTPRPWVGRQLFVNWSGDADVDKYENKAWYGYVVSVKPTVVLSPTGGKVKRAIIHARGPFMYLARQVYGSQKWGEGTAAAITSEALRRVSTDMTVQSGLAGYYMGIPQQSELEAGIPNPERFLGTRIPERFWSLPGETLLSAARRIADFEGGEVIEVRNVEGANSIVGSDTFFLQAGNYRTSWQYAISPEGGWLFTDEARSSLDATDIPYTYIELINTNDDIINFVECEVADYEAGQEEVLWALPEANTTDGTAPFIAIGESIDYEFTFPASTNAATVQFNGGSDTVVGVDSYVTPLTESGGTIDLVSNTEPDGSGSNMTQYVGGFLTFQGVNRATLRVSNDVTSTDDAYITKLQVRGNPLIKNTSTVVSASDEDSIDAYGLRRYVRRNDLETNIEEAQSWADRTLARYKDPHPALRLVFSPNYSENAAKAGYRIQVGDRIEVKANATNGSGLGFQEFFYVERIAHDITFPEGGEKNWRCEFLCSWTPQLVTLGGDLDQTGTVTPSGP